MRRALLLLLVLCVQACGACGDYGFDGRASPETCGPLFGAFGFRWEADHMVQVIATPDGDDMEAFDYIPTWLFFFDSRHLEPGDRITADTGELIALCSRYKPDLPGDATYYTEYTGEASVEVVKTSNRTNLDGESWVMRWESSCEQLQMSATGDDVVELDPDPIPGSFDFDFYGTPSDWAD